MVEENKDGEKTRTETEWKGLMNDKQNEVRARQQMQSESAVKDAKIAEQNKQIEDLLASGESEEELEKPATRADLLAQGKKTKQELIDLHKKETDAVTAEEKDRFVNKSFNVAIKKHTVEKDGKGLSFDDVMEGTKRQILENKTNRTLIENDTNPGEKAYQIGLQDPVIAERHAMYKKTLAEQKKTKKVGMDGTTIPGEYYTQERVKTMSKEDIKLHLAEIRESQKTWKHTPTTG